MHKLLVLLLIFVVLSGCNRSSVGTPTVTILPETAVELDLPTPTEVPEPIATALIAAITPDTQPSTVPTILSPSLSPTASLRFALPVFSYPIGVPGKPLGDGYYIRHSFAAENTWYNPGYWHTGEDWYAVEGDTAGANVFAVADGVVVYTGGTYPGRVVIIRHAEALFSMYGHLDPILRIQEGQEVKRGDFLGTVLRRGDTTPNHLHFEIRTFLMATEVNGSAPRYPFRCGVNCPPGPGYWPIQAPDLPSDLGWRSPIHVIAHRMFLSPMGEHIGEVIVATHPVSESITLWSAPRDDPIRQAVDTLELHPGERFPLLAVYTGPEDARQTSALGYQLWYAIRLEDGREGWVEAAIPSTFETGSDGRPSTISFNFFLAIAAPI
jgi:murein DD-endopeptidase MepM/ murein hydrolase activator NlpD